MKAIIHVPTVQFGYIEIELENSSPEEIVFTHNKLIKDYNESLPLKDINDF